MAPRFDADSLTLSLSVADVVDAAASRSIGFANRGGYERMWLGQAIHSRYQEGALASDPTYRREVGLRSEFEHRGWRIVLEGRADGLRREVDGSWRLEEIKSVRRGASPGQATLELYRRQALLYAWMLSQDREEPVGAELILIQIGSDEIDRIDLEVDLQATEERLRARLNRLIRDFERQQEARRERREAAAGLPFPYAETRPGQDEILAAVETAVEQREHLLLQATTGIGKTVAAIHPALRHALANDKRIFVLTAKTLQQEMAVAVLELINLSGVFHSLQLRAKAKMCANSEVICHEEYCPWARDYAQKLHRTQLLEGLLAEHPTLIPDAVYAAAEAAETCPFEVSLELAGRSQVVVGDYNYAFAPYIALREFGDDGDLADAILIIDEIHNLVDRGRDYYSPELSAREARRAADGIGRGGDPIHRRIGALCLDLAELVERTVEHALDSRGDRVSAVESPLPEDDLLALRPELDALFVDYLEYRKETRSMTANDAFVDLYFALLRFLEGLQLAQGDAFSRCVERSGDDARLKVLCKDPSRFLGRILGRAHAVIGLSATLSPPEFYRDLLGFDPDRTVHLAVPTPFPAENRRIVIDASVATTWKQRADNYEPIARRLAALADEVPGNCLALFPSYAFLREVSERLESGRKRVLVQQRADSDAAREEILKTLRSALLGDVLLLAVAGGVFAEGVDYPGDVLKAVAVVGPCLPAVSLERDLLRLYYQERFERGFEYAFVVPGMTRVVQAAGRLIRSAGDTGVIALFDRRFLMKPYRRHLPPDWIPDGGVEALAGDPDRAGREFFSQNS
jgi:DNA excision repair protein ERCC-2